MQKVIKSFLCHLFFFLFIGRLGQEVVVNLVVDLVAAIKVIIDNVCLDEVLLNVLIGPRLMRCKHESIQHDMGGVEDKVHGLFSIPFPDT